MMRRSRWLRLNSMLLLGLTACGGESKGGGENADDATVGTDSGETPDSALEDAGPAGDAAQVTPDALAPDANVGPPFHPSTAFEVRGSVEQVQIWGAAPGTAVELVSADGTVTATGTADDNGALLLRKVPPAEGYLVRPAAAPDDYAGPVTVMSIEGSQPDQAFYAGQPLNAGFGYLTMRDGTKLSVFVTLPGPPEEGPYPTVISYSGYSPSNPNNSLGAQVEGLCGDTPVLCDPPDDPSNLVAALNGFATVGVNMRGTGCSGGAYDYFEPLQSLDGYDMVETVAAQPWVQGHRVGLVGLSYPGISQLFVAATQPPSLAAIAPQSVIADSTTSCLMPGGIYNDGFAFEWHKAVLDHARPYDPGWVKEVVAAGDTLCDVNQKMHGQMRDALTEALEKPFYTDDIAKPVDPSAFVDRIHVPVFMTGQWQDEQTGPHFAALLDRFTNAPVKRFTMTNGVHIDGFAPQNLVPWLEFLNLYVADRVPVISDKVRALGTIFMSKVFEAPIAFPDTVYGDFPDAAAARAAYEADPQVKVIFESGADPAVPAGAPQGTFTQMFPTWPIAETVADRWYFEPGGVLDKTEPAADGGSSSFVTDPEAGERTNLASGGVGSPQPDWAWPPLVEGKAVAFTTAPLAENATLLGFGSVDLWVRVDAVDADLEVNVSEVRPDGQESYVQSGWLRASREGLRADATELRPIHSQREEDVKALVPGEWTQLRVEIMPMGHIFRAGSRLRISVDTPGDSRASWRFRLLTFDTPPTIEIGHDAEHPSSVALPLVPGIQIPTALPACNALRGQPCRAYVPAANGG